MAIWPFSTRVNRSRISWLGSPIAIVPGDIGGAVLVLRAGIDQKQLAGGERTIGPPGHPVVDYGAVRARA
jgi:hypothetical protein